MAAAGGIAKRTYCNYEVEPPNDMAREPSAGFLSAIAPFGADVLYILTGQRPAGAASTAGISHREAALLDNYRACAEEDQRAIDQIALSASAQREGTPVKARKGRGKA